MVVPISQGSNTTRGAHVVSWELHHGRAVPIGMDVLHKCDNPSCIEPKHLKLGTHQDNMDDKVRKGRQSRMVGRDHPAAKLDEEKVRAILSDCRLLRQVASHYGVSESTISLIRLRKTWKHVT